MPLPGHEDIAHADLPAVSRIGISAISPRAGVVKMLPFERLVRPMLLVQSPPNAAIASPVAVSHGGRGLRETRSRAEFNAATDPVFIDVDRLRGDGILVYLPPGFADPRVPMRIHYAASVTTGALAVLWSAFAVALAAAMVLRSPRIRSPRERSLLAAATAAALAGLALVGLNVAGLLMPVDPVFPEPGRSFVGSAHEVREAVEAEIRARPGETTTDYAVRMHVLVSDNVLHIWNYGSARDLGIHVPLRANYVLSLLGELSPGLYRYTYADWRRGLERGAGMCSQQTLILVGLLRDQGYDARFVQLDGHTVVTAEVSPGTWYVMDPDYGVLLERDLPSLEKDPEWVRERYRARLAHVGHPEPAAAAAVMAGFYGPEGNVIEPKGANLMMGEAWVVREKVAGWIKWLLPAGLLALALALAYRVGVRASFSWKTRAPASVQWFWSKYEKRLST
jgi:hypothetical protein